jgi:hypothetical protein
MSLLPRCGCFAVPNLPILLLALFHGLAWGQGPEITQQPADSHGAFGALIQLTVTTHDATSYQWFRGASGDTTGPVDGGTSASLSLVCNHVDSYWVRASNSAGSIDSRAASITMDEPRLTSNFSTFAWGPGFSWDTRTYRVSGVASSEHDLPSRHWLSGGWHQLVRCLHRCCALCRQHSGDHLHHLLPGPHDPVSLPTLRGLRISPRLSCF